MKMLHILNELRFSGAETMLRSAAGEFRDAGWEGHVLATGEVPGAYAPALADAGYRLHHLPFAKSAGFFRQVGALLRRERFDLVHVHSERASAPYALLAAVTGARTVRTVHHPFAFEGALRLRKAAERGFCARLLGTRSISISPTVRRNEAERFGNASTLCWNWYDDRAFAPPGPAERADARARLGVGPDEFMLVTVGNAAPGKNYPLVLEAMARLGPGLRLRYVHVGEDEAGRPLATLAERLGLTGAAAFPGRSAEPARYLHAADCYLMPSDREGFGIAAVEAMAAGLPAILSDRPALTDFAALSPEIVYTPPRAEALAGRIVALADMPDGERRALGERLAVVMRREFSAAAGARRYLAVYDTALRGREVDRNGMGKGE